MRQLNPLVTAQAAAYVINLAGGAYDYDLLVKTLYIADYEFYKDTQQFMTGILFNIGFEDETWNKHISRDETRAFVLADPGDDEMSIYYEETLCQIWQVLEAVRLGEVS